MPLDTRAKSINISRISSSFSILCLTIFISGCGNSSSSNNANNRPTNTETEYSEPFALQFNGMVGAMPLNCDDTYVALGTNQNYSIGVGDLRFYVSNIKLFNASGSPIGLKLDDNAFQLNHPAGAVALIDLSNNNSGYCELASEGTARTNSQLTGLSTESDIASIRFDIGVPQATMKAVIASTDNVADTASPLAEMYWSWASGYRHFVLNFTVMDSAHMDFTENSGVHLGSRDCGGVNKALSDQEACGLLNTPKVVLENFDPAVDSVVVDIAKILENIQASDISTNNNFGVQCHSGMSQAACQSLFPSFGLDILTGQATAPNNSVFKKQ